MSYRIGQGTDFHRLEKGRPFWLGGILIPHHKGAMGHSDADVLLHAICDALLGALCLGDIGHHFPDTDPAFKNIDSKILLGKTYELIQAKAFRIVNIDATVCLESPRIKNFIPEMQKAISTVLHLQVDEVSIKATTTEKLGFVGREEGVMAHAVALMEKIN